MNWFVIRFSGKWVAVRGSQAKHPVSLEMELFLEPPYVSEGESEYGPLMEGEAHKFAEKMNQLDKPAVVASGLTDLQIVLDALACYEDEIVSTDPLFARVQSLIEKLQAFQ